MILGVFYLRQAGPNALPIQRRSTSACAIVPRSTYSSSLPTGTPRASDGVVQEVILATNFNAEGEATAHVLSEALKSRGLHVTRLARGVPVGSELEYVDLGTIAHALVDRR